MTTPVSTAPVAALKPLLVTRSEAAALLGVSVRAFDGLCHRVEGIARARRVLPGMRHPRFIVKVLEAYVPHAPGVRS